MMPHVGRILLVTAAFFGSVLTASADVVNGNFEGGTTTGNGGVNGELIPIGWTNGPPSPSSLSDINVSTAVDAATFLGPHGGTHYVRFQSTANNGTRDCLLQDFATTAGTTYIVTFSVAITTDSSFGGSANTSLDPQWDELGNDTAMVKPIYFTPTAAFQYQTFTFTEVASSNTTRIDFHGVDATGSILLDDVSVIAAVPEPASFILLGFSAAVSFGVHRFNRTRKRTPSAC